MDQKKGPEWTDCSHSIPVVSGMVMGGPFSFFDPSVLHHPVGEHSGDEPPKRAETRVHTAAFGP